MPIKIAAVVILYHPNEVVLQNISSYLPYVNQLFVFDNTEVPCTFLTPLLGMDKVLYYHDGNNGGIAKRLNQALQLAYEQGFYWLLTMDQDTRFGNQQMQPYLACINTFTHKEAVAMFGTCYSNQVQEADINCSYSDVENLITSGTILNLSATKKIGAFDENLFIDSVDHDYVIRARLQGYRVVRFNHISLVHQLGNLVHRSSIKTLYLVKKSKVVHSPLRCYYMYRNMLYLHKKYKSANTPLARQLKKIVTGNLWANIFYGGNTFRVLIMLAKAQRDFARNHMGQIQ